MAPEQQKDPDELVLSFTEQQRAVGENLQAQLEQTATEHNTVLADFKKWEESVERRRRKFERKLQGLRQKHEGTQISIAESGEIVTQLPLYREEVQGFIRKLRNTQNIIPGFAEKANYLFNGGKVVSLGYGNERVIPSEMRRAIANAVIAEENLNEQQISELVAIHTKKETASERWKELSSRRHSLLREIYDADHSIYTYVSRINSDNADPEQQELMQFLEQQDIVVEENEQTQTKNLITAVREALNRLIKSDNEIGEVWKEEYSTGRQIAHSTDGSDLTQLLDQFENNIAQLERFFSQVRDQLIIQRIEEKRSFAFNLLDQYSKIMQQLGSVLGLEVDEMNTEQINTVITLAPYSDERKESLLQLEKLSNEIINIFNSLAKGPTGLSNLLATWKNFKNFDNKADELSQLLAALQADDN